MMRIFVIILTAFVLTTSCACSENTGVTYYVSPNGSDDNSGTEIDEPLLTVQRGIDSLDSGDKLIILPGVYNEACYFDSEEYDELVTIEGKSGAILDGKGIEYEGLIIECSSNIRVSGLEVRNYKCAGINVLDSSNIIVSDNKVHDNGFDSSDYEWDHEGYGINLKYSENTVTDGNIVYANGPSHEIIDKFGKLGTGINTYELYDSQIINNKIYDNRGGGILIEDGIDIIATGNTSKNHRVEAYYDPKYPEEGKWWCGGIWIDGGSLVLVSNNSFVDNKAGILISNFDEQEPYGYEIKKNKLSFNYYGIEIMDFTPPLDKNVINIVNNKYHKNKHDLYFDDAQDKE